MQRIKSEMCSYRRCIKSCESFTASYQYIHLVDRPDDMEPLLLAPCLGLGCHRAVLGGIVHLYIGSICMLRGPCRRKRPTRAHQDLKWEKKKSYVQTAPELQLQQSFAPQHRPWTIRSADWPTECTETRARTLCLLSADRVGGGSQGVPSGSLSLPGFSFPSSLLLFRCNPDN